MRTFIADITTTTMVATGTPPVPPFLPPTGGAEVWPILVGIAALAVGLALYLFPRQK